MGVDLENLVAPEDFTKKNEKANLTCEASTARPPATFRWFVVKSDDDDDDDDTSATPVEITSGILTPTPTLDTSGKLQDYQDNM